MANQDVLFVKKPGPAVYVVDPGPAGRSVLDGMMIRDAEIVVHGHSDLLVCVAGVPPESAFI